MNTLQTIDLQLQAINHFFAELRGKNDRLVYIDNNNAEDADSNASEALAA
jgi:tRNA-dihydrouridine synthase B